MDIIKFETDCQHENQGRRVDTPWFELPNLICNLFSCRPACVVFHIEQDQHAFRDSLQSKEIE